jgi:predicted dinucleotide-utilizing enzyme
MEAPEKTLDYLEQQIPGLSAAAVRVAYWQALAAGQDVLVSGEGGIYQMLPDGSRKLVKTTSARMSVPVGTKVRIP